MSGGRRPARPVAHGRPVRRRSPDDWQVDQHRRALVYRGPAAYPGCPEAAAALLRCAEPSFEVSFVGPAEALPLSASVLATAALYVQPGGGRSLRPAFHHMQPYAGTIRRFVVAGGRYLGICMGGYLAGHWHGFGLLPGDSDQFVGSPGALLRTDADTVVPVDWRGRRRSMYFQDGPLFRVQPDSTAVVLARYSANGEVAALVADTGAGRIGVCGPHPEAPLRWYRKHGLVNPDGVRPDLGHDLVATLMA